MARISKPGLDYFPLDVNFLQDRKVRRISYRHHAAGIAALTSILCLIYKEKGYYVSWNKDTLFDIAQEACCEEEEMQAIIDDCLAVGLFDSSLYNEYKVLTSEAIQEQYHKIITDSRRRCKLPLERFWIIKKEEKEENETNDGDTKSCGMAANSRVIVANTRDIAATIPQTKQEIERDREIKSETEKDKETERQGKAGKESESENEKPPVPSNGIFRALPVVVNGLSLENSSGGEGVTEINTDRNQIKTRSAGNNSEDKSEDNSEGNSKGNSEGVQTGGGSEAILLLNMEAIGIRNEQTVKAIAALARRKELGGPGGVLWKILSSEYRSTLLKKNEPGDYILWALNHPTEFESTYNGTLKKMVRGR